MKMEPHGQARGTFYSGFHPSPWGGIPVPEGPFIPGQARVFLGTGITFFTAFLLIALEGTGLYAEGTTPSMSEAFVTISFQRGKSLKEQGWEEKIYNEPVRYDVVGEEKEPCLRARSDAAASMIYKRIDYDPAEYPLLRWSWKLEQLPDKGRENTASHNDYGARVYVIFPGWTFLTSYLLEYVWDNETSPGTIKPSPSGSPRVKHIVVNSGTKDMGKWVAVGRNIVKDYEKAFGKKPDRRVGAIGLMTDADNTSSKAEAYYGPVMIGK
jgi:hypothetical protein